MKKEQEKMVEAILYGLFKSYCEEIEKKPKADDEQAAIKYFAELERVDERSEYALLFRFFRAGVMKGYDLGEILLGEEKSK